MEEFYGKQNPFQENMPKRPASLTILCILTFIWSGISFFSNLSLSVLYDYIIMYFQQIKASGISFPGMELIKDIPRQYYVLQFMLSAGSFFGAVMMWRLKKPGFHLYTVSQLLMIVVSMVFLGISFSSLPTFITLIFIMLYAMNLKFMKS